jgi:hypothetical protein
MRGSTHHTFDEVGVVFVCALCRLCVAARSHTCHAVVWRCVHVTVDRHLPSHLLSLIVCTTSRRSSLLVFSPQAPLLFGPLLARVLGLVRELSARQGLEQVCSMLGSFVPRAQDRTQKLLNKAALFRELAASSTWGEQLAFEPRPSDGHQAGIR